MSTVYDIIGNAFDGNAEGVKAALDAQMAARVSDALSDLRIDVASRMFAAPEQETTVEPSAETTGDEGQTSDENI